MPVLPNGLKMMADQGFKFQRLLLIPPSKLVQLPERVRKLVCYCAKYLFFNVETWYIKCNYLILECHRHIYFKI